MFIEIYFGNLDCEVRMHSSFIHEIQRHFETTEQLLLENLFLLASLFQRLLKADGKSWRVDCARFS